MTKCENLYAGVKRLFGGGQRSYLEGLKVAYKGPTFHISMSDALRFYSLDGPQHTLGDVYSVGLDDRPRIMVTLCSQNPQGPNGLQCMVKVICVGEIINVNSFSATVLKIETIISIIPNLAMSLLSFK